MEEALKQIRVAEKDVSEAQANKREVDKRIEMFEKGVEYPKHKVRECTHWRDRLLVSMI